MKHRFALAALLLGLCGNSIAQEMTPSSLNGWWTGVSEIQNHSLRVKVEKGLADVEEECLIVPREDVYGATLSDQSTPLELKGYLRFPKGSAVVGMFLWNGSTILKAKLKPTWIANEEYEDVVDRPNAPPPAPRDPAILTRVDDDSYNLRIYPSYLNASRRVRIRYLVPVSSDSSGSYLNISPVFSGEGKVSLSVQSDIASQLTVLKDGVMSSIELPVEIEYSNVTSLQIASSVKTTSLRTSFSSGDWNGSYWWMKAGIPKELTSKVNPNIEVVVLWKWNFPEHFLYPAASDRAAWPTAYGNQALEQAIFLGNLIINAHRENEKIAFGLIHQVGPNETNVFPIGRYGSKAYSDQLAYLNSINYEFIKERFPPLNKQYKMQMKDFEAQKEQGKLDFENILKKAVALYSPDSNAVKYVVVLSAGLATEIETPSVADLNEISQQKNLYFGVANLCKSSDGNYTSWPGVDLNALQNKYGYESSKLKTFGYSYSAMYNYTNFDMKLPLAQDLHYSATFKLNGVNKVVAFNAENDELGVVAHTSSPQDSLITWKAFDQNGVELSSIKQTISSTYRANDSAIAKVVAAAPNMTSFKYPEREIGATWGVVRTDFSLVALEGDSIGSTAQQTIEKGGLPYLTDDEIFMPEPVNTLDQASHLRNMFIIRNLGAKQIKFEITGKLKNNLERAEIIDLSGNVVRQLDVEQLKKMGEFTWDGSASGSGVYFLRAKAQGVVFQKKFIL